MNPARTADKILTGAVPLATAGALIMLGLALTSALSPAAAAWIGAHPVVLGLPGAAMGLSGFVMFWCALYVVWNDDLMARHERRVWLTWLILLNGLAAYVFALKRRNRRRTS